MPLMIERLQQDYSPPIFLHGILLTKIFEDHPVALLIVKDLDTILDTVSSARATRAVSLGLFPLVTEM